MCNQIQFPQLQKGDRQCRHEENYRRKGKKDEQNWILYTYIRTLDLYFQRVLHDSCLAIQSFVFQNPSFLISLLLAEGLMFTSYSPSTTLQLPIALNAKWMCKKNDAFAYFCRERKEKKQNKKQWKTLQPQEKGSPGERCLTPWTCDWSIPVLASLHWFVWRRSTCQTKRLM